MGTRLVPFLVNNNIIITVGKNFIEGMIMGMKLIGIIFGL